jgi:hypothetical protein
MELIRFNDDGQDAVDASKLHAFGVLGNDYTLCGDSTDGDPTTVGSWKVVRAPAVTCKDCIAVILHCRGMRVARSNAM